MKKSKRSLSLDFLRGIAIILVIGTHGNLYPGMTKIPLVNKLLKVWNDIGWIGVDLFFVLSGYLVTGLLFKEFIKNDKINFKRFYIRRGLKIYPAFYFFMLYSFFYYLFLKKPVGHYDFFSELLFVQNYFGHLWGHTWSLAIEEHFYFLIGLLFVVLIKLKSMHKMVPIFYTVALSVLGFRIFLRYQQPEFDNFVHYTPTHLRVDSLFMGSLLSYYYHFHYEKFKSFYLSHKHKITMVFIASLLSVIFSTRQSVYMTTFGFTVLYIGFAALLLSSIFESKIYKRIPGFIFKPFAWIGFYSYSIYLWHYAFKYLTYGYLHRITKNEDILTYVGFVIYSSLSIFLGVLLAKLVEMPVIKLRDKYFS